MIETKDNYYKLNNNEEKDERINLGLVTATGNVTLFEDEVPFLLIAMRDRGIQRQYIDSSKKRYTHDIVPQKPCLLSSKNFQRESKNKSTLSTDEEFRLESEWDENGENFDEDDDEWIESHRFCGPISQTPTDSPHLPRKKAPSGSACEKHKRWKKRCPDDCPMRKTKNRKKPGQRSDSESTEQFSKRNVTIQTSRHAITESTQTDYFSLLHWSIGLTKESKSGHEITKIEQSIGKKEEVKVDKRMVSTKGSKDRKINIVQKSRVSNTTSMIKSDNLVEDEEAFDIKELDSSEFSSPECRQPPQKKPRIINNKGRSGRKYLPQACDRHKLLHAKCPANCPDRLKRDTEQSKILFFGEQPISLN